MSALPKWACALALIALAACNVQGMIIQQVEPDASRAELTGYTVDASNPDYYDVHLDKTFKTADMIGSPLVLLITLEAADSAKDIHLTETVTNATGEDWFDYHFVLVNQPTGVPALPWAGAYFVTPAQDPLVTISSDVFGTPTADADSIDFTTGGPVGSPGVVNFSGIVIRYDAGADPQASFYLKEIPTVPEPATLALLALGGAALRKRRR